ncbi:MAG: TspO/MBR family protein [Jannaschia sp.]
MDWTLFLLFLGACCAAGTTGSMFPPGQWYRDLSKPVWTPPDLLFPIAWSILYLCLAFAGARVAPLEGSQYAMAFWAIQIALNTLWTPVFFGLRRMRAALVIICLLWVSVLSLLISLWPLDRAAFWAIVPYLAWVTVAGALNASVLRRNPDTPALA